MQNFTFFKQCFHFKCFITVIFFLAGSYFNAYATKSFLIGNPPVAINDTAHISMGGNAVAQVSANDSDPDGDLNPMSTVIKINPKSGTANAPGLGYVIYTPATSFVGKDSLQYEISDALNNKATAWFYIYVTSSVTCTLTADYTYADSGLVVKFTPNQTGLGFIYMWDFGDSTATSFLDTPSHTFANQGNYNVCLIIREIASGCSDTICKSVDLTIPSCNLNPTINVSVMPGREITATATPTGNFLDPKTYIWNYGDGTNLDTTTSGFLGGGNSTTHIFGADATYNICVSVTNNVGYCRDIICASTIVSSSATGCGITADFSFTQDSIGTVNFVAQPEGAAFGANPQYTYVWDYGNGQTEILQTGIFGGGNTAMSTYLTTSNYNVCLMVHDSSTSCTDTICKSIAVIVNPIVCNLNADHSFTQDSLGTVTLTASPGGPANSYFWDFGDGTNQSGNGGGFFTPAEDAIHNYAQSNGAGTYSVCLILTVNASQCSDTVCKNVNVVIDSATVCAINASFVYVTDSAGNADFTGFPATTTFSGDSYIWNYGDGGIDTVGGFFVTNTASHIYATSGTYNVCLNYNKGNGCTANYCENVVVIVVPLSIRAKNSKLENSISVSPNPSKDNFSVGYCLLENSYVTIELYDVLGAKVNETFSQEQKIGAHVFKLNAENLRNGIYLLKMQIGNQIVNRTIIKQ